MCFGGLPSLEEFSTVFCDPHKDFAIVNKAKIDFFLELSCFFVDPVDFGNLISGSSVFSKTSLNIWKFMVHVFHAKIGTIKDRNHMDEKKQKILRKGGKNTQKIYTKKYLNDPDKYNGVITHLEPEILESEVK